VHIISCGPDIAVYLLFGAVTAGRADICPFSIPVPLIEKKLVLQVGFPVFGKVINNAHYFLLSK